MTNKITGKIESFEDLLASYLSGNLDAKGKKELLEIILIDPEKGEEYRKIAQLKSQLDLHDIELSSEFPKISPN
ncbi:hypothetical protein LEP1GSC047_1332 [Leptospira inadai serovar Lyme str. 10]|uniref:Uncharacterized protein n=2 Tax=Leptospira inadai serovar Lyme TaxID=293084 RepID=V6H8F2_9LEPT|nr:hypothetical protein [Leptospira inadai]EQA34992.1 hypothetical protein LEP1GSC047_1332 [Leptospira inadai serovar Lyme str. 10]PNV76054.1 hypothetical protein BES34_006020 [Leptospira inadai serovar Lyme]